ncbi:major facilitator superfamily MFS-1 [Fusarium mundagurra]|uniref:Major facilitator superfamily MFS-1 n=1 Tax=Fusarium mundagurra TaxID=1567541 RepID=A0A8H5Y3G8_9HYPO|nr:major facilitator superfamily MFS-1 [Fusarium mundagurra]
MNFGKNSKPKLKTETPFYHLALSFSHRPFLNGPFRLGTIVNNLVEYFPLNQGLNNVVPIPDGQRYYDTTSDALADVQHSRDGQGGLLVSALDGIIGGNASLHRGRHDGDVYRIDNVETTYFYPEDDYYEKCLQLHQVERFNKKFKYKKPIYLITGLKVAHRASITMESGRQIGGNTEANVQVPTVPVDLEVGAQAGASSSSEVVSSFTKPDAFILAIQVRKIYHKRAFLSGETKLATETVVKGAVLVDDDDIEDKDDEADEVNYELHDLDEEDMKDLTLLTGEDGDEA